VIYSSSFLSADNTIIYAIESNVTVTCGGGGHGIGVLGVANRGTTVKVQEAFGLAVIEFAVFSAELVGANLSIRAVNTTAAVRASGVGYGTVIAGFAVSYARFNAISIVIYVSQSILTLTCAQGSAPRFWAPEWASMGTSQIRTSLW
jgi:hypothetical protein